MKYISTLFCWLSFLVFTTTIISCQKDKDAAVVPKSTGLVGRWDLYETTGGFAGTTTNVTAGTSQLEFTADSVVRIYERNTLIDTRQYSVRPTIDPADGSAAKMLFYISPGVRYIPKYVKVDTDNLTLIDDVADGFTYRYRRLK